MGAQIAVYNNGQRMAVTNNAFNAIVKKELMREWILNFSITNRDSARQYVIDPNAQFEAEGQLYDTKSYKQSNGTDNTTSVTAYHVLARLNNYIIPTGYAFVGTLAAIITDILNVSGAGVEFMLGSRAAGVSGSYSLGNTQPTTAYSAIMGLVAMGVEPSFDNFTINAEVRWGEDTGKVFKFGRDLCSLERTFDKTTVPYTYSYGIDIANLQRIAGAPFEFDIGDTAGIQDSLIGDSIIGQRIISYEKCLDDPTQDKVIIGNFISDMADSAIAMQIGIDGSVQQAEQYSNVSIDHQNGFMAVNAAGTIGVKMNADNCFAVYSISGGVWTLLSQLDINGLQAGTLKSIGSTIYGIISNTTAGVYGLRLADSVGNVYFFEVGELSGGGCDIRNKGRRFMYIDDDQSTLRWNNADNSHSAQVKCDTDSVKLFKDESLKFYADENGIHLISPNGSYAITLLCNNSGVLTVNGAVGFSGTTAEGFNFTDGLFTGGGAASVGVGTTGNNAHINVDRGIVTGWNYPALWSGTITISGVGILHFDGGALTSIT